MSKQPTGRQPTKDLAKEAAEWDRRVRTPEGWTDAPEAIPRLSASASISLRVPVDMLAILKEFARREGTGYQVLMKRWLDERIREERGRLSQRSSLSADKG